MLAHLDYLILLLHQPNRINRSMNNDDNFSKNKMDGSGYRTFEYLSPSRMSSYGHQYSLAMKSKGTSLLNIGSGNDLLSQLLSRQGKFVVDFDLNYSTNPTVCGKLPFLPFLNSSFDVVLCFQMLEHLPFSLLPICMKEFTRIGTKFVIISLPDVTYKGYEKLKHYTYKFLKHPKVWKKYQKSDIDIEHEWEIGAGIVDERTIIQNANVDELALVRHFRNDLNTYHHFFVWKICYKSTE